MTRCREFYEKVEREGFEWCNKSDDTIRLIDFYLDLVNDITKHGISKDAVFIGLSEYAARPLYKNGISDDCRKITVTNIAGKLKRGEKISAIDVKLWMDAADGKIKPKTPVPVQRCTEVQLAEACGSAEVPARVVAKDPQPLHETVSPKIHTPPANVVKGQYGAAFLRIEGPSAVVCKSTVPNQPKPDRQLCEVIVTRSLRAGFQQMIDRRMYDDLEQAVQACMEIGWEREMDRVDTMLNDCDMEED